MAAPPAAEKEKDPVVGEVTAYFDVKTLKERCHKLQAEVKELKHNNYLLETLLTKQRDTQVDILKTLHANADERFEKISEQEAYIRQLHRQLQQMEDENARHRADDAEQAARKQAELQLKIDHLQAALDELTTFRQEKDAIDAELESLRGQLKEQREGFDKEFHRLERKKGIEFNELKSDVQRATQKLNDSLKLRTKEQLGESTKKAIAENEQMKTELSVHCKQTEWLLARNQALTDENAKLRRHLNVHKDLEKELVKRSHVQQRLISKFSEQKGQTPSVAENGPASTPEGEDDALQAALQVRENRTRESRKESDRGQSRGDGKLLELRATRLQEELDASKNAHRQTRLEFSRYRKEHQTLAQLQDWGAREVAAALQQLRTSQEFPTSGATAMDSSEGFVGFSRFDRLARSDREVFMTRLLDVLHTSACKDCQQVLSGSASWSRTLSKATSSPALPPISRGAAATPAPGEAAGSDGADRSDLGAFLRSLGAGTEASSDRRTIVTEEKAVQATDDMRGGQYARSYAELPRGLQPLGGQSKGSTLRPSGLRR